MTAGDFTTEMDISATMWGTYLDIHNFDEELDVRSDAGHHEEHPEM